jgi:hypothetical protein
LRESAHQEHAAHRDRSEKTFSERAAKLMAALFILAAFPAKFAGIQGSSVQPVVRKIVF